MLELGAERQGLRRALLAIDRLRVREIIVATRRSSSLPAVIDGLIVPVLEGIGTGWEKGEIALSEVYMSGRIAEEIVTSLLSAEPSGFSRAQPRIGVVTLEDSHVLGKQIVTGLLAAAGYVVEDLGQRASVDATVARVRERGIGILLVSVLMLRSALSVANLKRRLMHEGLENVRVVVGGAPFRLDPNLWREVGADACGWSASDAIEIVCELGGSR